MLKIYGASHSRAFRVIWLANEIGIPYEHIPVSFSVPHAQCKEPWYIALNPNARVPTIDDDGFVMWEAAAINLYLTLPRSTKTRSTRLRRKGGVECSNGLSL
jgi:glutathione S-transferase